MMKIQPAPLFLIFILLSATVVMPVAASGTDRVNVNTVTVNSGTVNHFSNGMKYVEVCHVRTKGGNLNVRNAENKIIGTLPNGTEVNVITYLEESTWLEITAYVGRNFIRGFVEESYIDCHQ